MVLKGNDFDVLNGRISRLSADGGPGGRPRDGTSLSSSPKADGMGARAGSFRKLGKDAWPDVMRLAAAGLPGLEPGWFQRLLGHLVYVPRCLVLGEQTTEMTSFKTFKMR